jgi:hypothetical protein
MPPPVSKRQRVILIDEEWASTLIGLPMQVPNSWWNGYNKDDKTLNVGTIVGIDFDAPQSSYFQLECVGEPTPCRQLIHLICEIWIKLKDIRRGSKFAVTERSMWNCPP